MNRKTKRYITWTLILAAVSFLVIKIFYGFSELNRDFTENLPSTYSLTAEDSSIICKNYWGRLKVNEVVRNEVRGPVSLIFFDKDYDLLIYKLNLLNDTLLKDLIHMETKSVDRSIGYSYRIMNNGVPFRFQYKAGKTYPISRILLTLAGDSLSEIVKTDSIMGYHLLCKNFSIRYSKEEPIDLFFEGKSHNQRIPMDLLFVKKGKTVFLIVMNSRNPNISIPSDLLYGILADNCV